jgi:ABC-2 type transport system ATP-binding protein
MMHQPDLLILDEPTGGLDPLMQQTFNELMREWRDAGRTVFLSSHVLSEVQAICDRVGILRGGQLKAVETVARLMHADFRWVNAQFRAPLDAGALRQFAGLPGVSSATADGPALRLSLTGDFDPLLRALTAHYVVNLKIHEPTLEEIFLAFYGERGEALALNGARETVAVR